MGGAGFYLGFFRLGEKLVRVAERVAKGQEYCRGGGPNFLEMDMC